MLQDKTLKCPDTAVKRCRPKPVPPMHSSSHYYSLPFPKAKHIVLLDPLPEDQCSHLDALPLLSTLRAPRIHKRRMWHSSTLLAIVTLQQ